jgi:hypothetical protein
LTDFDRILAKEKLLNAPRLKTHYYSCGKCQSSEPFQFI